MEQLFFTTFLRVGIFSVMSVSGGLWRSSFVLPEYGKELFYDLKANEVYGTVISRRYEAGLVLRVGKAWEKEIGDKNHQVQCRQLLGDDVYLDEYEPVIHFYRNPLSPKFTFTFMDKQVWNCTTYTAPGVPNPPSPAIAFYRIVNIVHIIVPVRTIFYFDGIEVSAEKTPIEPINHNSPIWTASFKEIKYINMATKEVLRYDGNLALSPPENLNVVPESNIFKPLEIFTESNYDSQNRRSENLGPIEKTAKTVIVDSSGDVLRVGKKEFQSFGEKNDKAECELVYLRGLYRNEYLPKCSIQMANSHNFEENYGESGGKVNENCFSITNQELWECNFYVKELAKNGKKSNNFIMEKFHRRETEMVGAIPLSKIEYFGAVSIWKYKLNSTSYSAKIKEIYYHEKDNIDKQIRFEGTVTLLKHGLQKQKEEKTAAIYSYNPDNGSANPQPILNGNGEPIGKVVRQLRSEIRSTGSYSGGGGRGGGGRSSSSFDLSMLFFPCFGFP